MPRQSNKEWSRQMLAKIKAAEAESLATTGLTLEQRRQREVEENFAALRRLRPLLAAVGVTITEKVYYLTRGTPEFSRALPVFFAELGGDYPEGIKMYMLQHLACKEASKYRPALVEALRTASHASEQFRYQLAVAVSETSGPADLTENIGLASDSSLGSSRMALLPRLARSPSPAAASALESLKHDPDLHKEIAAIFARKARYKAKMAARAA